jgi:hypothetical protein
VAALEGAEVPWRPPEERLPPPESPPPAPAPEVVRERIAALLAAPGIPRQRERDGKTVDYDLRPLVLDLRLASEGAGPGEVVLEMRLRVDPQGQGRPDEVAAALGLRARRIRRLRLGLEGDGA